MTDRPDHRADDEQVTAHGQRHGAGRRDPGPGRPHLMPPLPLVEGDRRAAGEPASTGASDPDRGRSRPGRPAARPSGMAGGAITTAARSREPARRDACQKPSQARYGAAATACQPGAARAVQPSQTATIGPHQAAAANSRRGSQPCRHAAASAPAATSDTGAAARSPRPRPASQAAAEQPGPPRGPAGCRGPDHGPATGGSWRPARAGQRPAAPAPGGQQPDLDSGGRPRPARPSPGARPAGPPREQRYIARACLGGSPGTCTSAARQP